MQPPNPPRPPLPPLPRTAEGSEDSFVLTCPLDSQDMDHVKAGNFTIDRCTKCGGLWFDMAELQRMIAHGMDALEFDNYAGNGRHQSVPRQLKCPRDGAVLAQTPDPLQPQIVYHQCETCGGLFLQAGNLIDLTHYSVGERLKSFFRM